MDDTGFFHTALLKDESQDIDNNGFACEPARIAKATRFLVSGLPPLLIPAEKDEWLRVKLCFAKAVWSYFVRLANNCFGDIQCIVDQHVRAKALRTAFNPLKGAVVLARHPNHQQIYRAVVIRKNKVKTVEVYFVDFGYICDVDTEEVFSVPPDTGLCDFPPQALCVMLNFVPEVAFNGEDFENACRDRLIAIRMDSVTSCSLAFSVEMVVVGDDGKPYKVSDVLREISSGSAARGTQRDSGAGCPSSADSGACISGESWRSSSGSTLPQRVSVSDGSRQFLETGKSQQSWNNKRQVGPGLEATSSRTNSISREERHGVSNSVRSGKDEMAEGDQKLRSGYGDVATGARPASSRDVLSRGLQNSRIVCADTGTYPAGSRQALASRELSGGNRIPEKSCQERNVGYRYTPRPIYAPGNTPQGSYGRSDSQYGSQSSVSESDRTGQYSSSYGQSRNNPLQANRLDSGVISSKAKWGSTAFNGTSDRGPSSSDFHNPGGQGSFNRPYRSSEERTAGFSGGLDEKKRDQLQADVQKRSFGSPMSYLKAFERRNKQWPISKPRPAESGTGTAESAGQKSEGDRVEPQTVLIEQKLPEGKDKDGLLNREIDLNDGEKTPETGAAEATEIEERLMQEPKEEKTGSHQANEEKQAECDASDVSERLGNTDLKESNKVVEGESTTPLCNNWDDEVPGISECRESTAANVTSSCKINGAVVHVNNSKQNTEVADVVVPEENKINVAAVGENNSGQNVEVENVVLPEEKKAVFLSEKRDGTVNETVAGAELELPHQKQESEVLKIDSDAASGMNAEGSGFAGDDLKCGADDGHMVTASPNKVGDTSETSSKSCDLMKEVLKHLENLEPSSCDDSVVDSMVKLVEKFARKHHKRQEQQESVDAMHSGDAGDADEDGGEK